MRRRLTLTVVALLVAHQKGAPAKGRNPTYARHLTVGQPAAGFQPLCDVILALCKAFIIQPADQEACVMGTGTIVDATTLSRAVFPPAGGATA
jgi:hypothetical protein